MDVNSRGGWIIHHAQKTKKVSCGNRFSNIQHAGTCGILLAALAGTQEATLSKEKAKTIGANAGLSTIEFNFAVAELKTKNLLDTTKDSSEIHLLGSTQLSVLSHTSSLYDSLEKSVEDDIAILIAESASNKPIRAARIKEAIQDRNKLTSDKVNSILCAAEEVGFFDKEQLGDDSLYFNGNLFRRDYVTKASKILDALTPDDARRMKELLATLQATPCVLLTEAHSIVGETLFKKLISIGLFDVSEISNPFGKTYYVSRPAAYSKYGTANDDPLDDAKALVTSLTYGMNQSTRNRGRIMDITALMGKLIDGGSVGPATAIGQDYTCLELKNVVKTERQSNGMYSMKLLKRDIGQLALQAIKSGDISPHSLQSFNSASISAFSGPEHQRVEARNSLSTDQSAVMEMLRSVRGQ